MYSVDDIRTPRDRVSEEFMRRLMEGEMQAGCCEVSAGAQHKHCAQRTESRGGGMQRREGMHRCEMLEGQSLAMLYSPCQIWRGIYAPDTALRRGTLFKELDKPWGVETKKGGCGCGK